MPHLPASSFSTSAIGFGCASLSAGSSRRHSIALVHAAYDAGIRHFDVAPPYGMGTAEDILGEALKSCRNDVTIATKVGFSRPRHAWAVMQIRSLAAPLRKVVPQLTRRVGASTYRGLTSRPKLDTSFVQSSLAESLRRLRTNHVDLLLLHGFPCALFQHKLWPWTLMPCSSANCTFQSASRKSYLSGAGWIASHFIPLAVSRLKCSATICAVVGFCSIENGA